MQTVTIFILIFLGIAAAILLACVFWTLLIQGALTVFTLAFSDRGYHLHVARQLATYRKGLLNTVALHSRIRAGSTLRVILQQGILRYLRPKKHKSQRKPLKPIALTGELRGFINGRYGSAVTEEYLREIDNIQESFWLQKFSGYLAMFIAIIIAILFIKHSFQDGFYKLYYLVAESSNKHIVWYMKFAFEENLFLWTALAATSFYAALFSLHYTRMHWRGVSRLRAGYLLLAAGRQRLSDEEIAQGMLAASRRWRFWSRQRTALQAAASAGQTWELCALCGWRVQSWQQLEQQLEKYRYRRRWFTALVTWSLELLFPFLIAAIPIALAYGMMQSFINIMESL